MVRKIEETTISLDFQHKQEQEQEQEQKQEKETKKEIKYSEIIKKIFDILYEIEEENYDKDDLIMIDGEFDSNCSKFEKMSNNGEIGVVCKNKNVGYCLLFFLRIIIDKNHSYLCESIDEFIEEYKIDYNDYVDDNDDDGIDYNDLVEYLGEKESTFTDIFKPNEKIVLRFVNGNKHINKASIKLKNIDDIQNSISKINF